MARIFKQERKLGNRFGDWDFAARAFQVVQDVFMKWNPQDPVVKIDPRVRMWDESGSEDFTSVQSAENSAAGMVHKPEAMSISASVARIGEQREVWIYITETMCSVKAEGPDQIEVLGIVESIARLDAAMPQVKRDPRSAERAESNNVIESGSRVVPDVAKESAQAGVTSSQGKTSFWERPLVKYVLLPIAIVVIGGVIVALIVSSL